MARLKKLVTDDELAVGERVVVGTNQEPGVVKFRGKTDFAEGEWVGVALDNPRGKNDGTVKDKRYFECKPKHGLFLRKSALIRVKAGEAVMAKTGTSKAQAKWKKAAALMRSLDDADLSMPSNGTATMGRTKSAPVSPNKGSKERFSSSQGLDKQNAVALTELRKAVEERDIETIRQGLTRASERGIPKSEIESAQRILNFESQKVLSTEIDKIRSVVGSLAETVMKVQERASGIERLSKIDSSQSTLVPWVTNVVQLVEQRLWTALEKRVDAKIDSAVKRVTGELMKAAVEPAKLKTAFANASTGGSLDAGLAQTSQARQRRTLKKAFVSASRDGSLEAGLAKMSQARQVDRKRQSAATKLQSAWRGKMARVKLDTSSISSAVKLARRRYKAWSSIYDEACAGNSSLDAAAFHAAITLVHPKYTRRQTSAIFEGYCECTGQSTLELPGFCNMAEACAIGDRVAAELADIHLDTFLALGKTGADQAQRKALKNAFVSASRDGSLEAGLAKMSQARQRKTLKKTFVSASRDGSLEAGLAKMSQARQRKTLKKAFVSASRDGSLEAGLAKMSQARQVDRKLQSAATKLQSAWRGKVARAKLDTIDLSSAIKLVRRRYKAWSSIYDEACAGNSSLDAAAFHTALTLVHPKYTRGQTSAIFKGYCECTGQSTLDLREFCNMAESCAIGDRVAAEMADINFDTFLTLGKTGADQAATRLQSAQRGRFERAQMAKRAEAALRIQRGYRKIAGGSSMRHIVKIAYRRHAAWASVFDETRGNSETLSESAFSNAVQQVSQKVSMGQAIALYRGYCKGTGKASIDLRGFCKIAEAVALGSKNAAEFADISVESYEMLGVSAADAAAVKVQSVARGRQARASASAARQDALEHEKREAVRQKASARLIVAAENGLLQQAMMETKKKRVLAARQDAWERENKLLAVRQKASARLTAATECGLLQEAVIETKKKRVLAARQDAWERENKLLAVRQKASARLTAASECGLLQEAMIETKKKRVLAAHKDAWEREKKREAVRQKARASLATAANNGLLQEVVNETKKNRTSG